MKVFKDQLKLLSKYHFNNKLLLVVVLVVLVASAIVMTKPKPRVGGDREKQVISQNIDPEPASASSVHTNYEEPSTNTELKVVDIEKDGNLEYQTLNIKVGVSVAFLNEDSKTHRLVADSQENLEMFDTGDLEPGQQITAVVYRKVGTYTYHCALHPQLKGTIIVED